MSSQIRVKSNKAKKKSSQIRVKSNIFDLTPIFDLRNAPSNNLPTPRLESTVLWDTALRCTPFLPCDLVLKNILLKTNEKEQ